jgi:hypothetical protein
MQAINSAIERDGFLFIGILGDKGLGKSVTGLNLTYSVLNEWDKALRHTIFTINDFSNLPYRNDLVRHEDGRVKVILWDDFALHTSSYGFSKRGERDLLIDFIEDFEVVREEVAVLIVTAATWDMIPPKLRDAAHIFIQMTKRGKGEIWAKQRGWLFLRKDYKKIGEIETEKIPDEVYNAYREMKRKAKRVKEKISLLKQKEKAEKLVEELTEEDWQDDDLLIALGIKDMHGNFTEFGKLVYRMWVDEADKNEANSFIFADLFTDAISQRRFEAILRSCGVKGNKDSLRLAYKEIVRYLEKKSLEVEA